MSRRCRRAAAFAVAAMVAAATSGRASAQAPPPPAPYEPPPGYGPPPPGNSPPPPGYGPPPQQYGYVQQPPPPSAQQVYLYEANSKSQGLALVLEIFMPGVGSIYADHLVGALVNWGLQIGGAVLFISGLNAAEERDNFDGPPTSHPTDAAVSAMVAGVVMMVGGRIYGLVDAWSSAGDYNGDLAARLGLADVSFTVTPVRTGNALAWGPALSLRF